MVRFALIVLGLCSALVAGLAFAEPAMAQSGVNGRNVTIVMTREANFYLRPSGRWVEVSNSSNARFSFAEENRDDWSVYLVDRSRGVRLQLDLHRGQIFYSDTGNPNRRPLYGITGSSARVDGYNAISVNYPGGFFRLGGGKQWVEVNQNGRYQFVEENRDEWSVYLYDRSREVRIQLDLYRKEIFISSPGQNRTVLYRVTAASAFR